jgi:tetratricopeptide (TPR) repeat protein
MKNKLKVWLILCIFLFATSIAVYAAGTSSSSWSMEEKKKVPIVSLYDQGVAAHKNNEFQGAKSLFEQALQEDPNNPDILNMLAHCQLKLGMVDESLETYKKALVIRPNFPEAREYLGEAYIQAALREIGTLKSYGSEGAEQLEDLASDFKQAASTL